MSTNVKNSVFVELHDLVVTKRKDDRFGTVVTTRSLNEDDLVKLAVSRRTDLNAGTLKAALEILREITIEQIANGASVRFVLGYFSLGVKGVFTGDNARWDPDLHKLNVNMVPVAELRETIQATAVEVRGPAAVGPSINLLTDTTSGDENKRLTPGGWVNISGSRMKITGDAKGVGISLISQANGEAIPVSSKAIAVNKPTQISFVVPVNLPVGDYKLSLTTQFSPSGTPLKAARTFLFDCVLNVP